MKSKELAWGLDGWEDDFKDFFALPVFREKKKGFFSACDFHEDENHYFFSLDVPGVEKDNLHIDYADGILTISGEKRHEYRDEDQKKGHHVYEKTYGNFKRSFNLPTPIEENTIKAGFRDGVLELLVLKAEAKKRKKIPISENGKTLFTKVIEAQKKLN